MSMCFADITDVLCPWAETHGHQCQLDADHPGLHECGCGHRWGVVTRFRRRVRDYHRLRRLLASVRSRPRTKRMSETTSSPGDA